MNDFKKCYNYSLNLISRRDYSKHKLSQKLRLRGHTQEEIDQTIDLLISQNYLREAEYKRIRIRQLLAKGYASNFIIQKGAQEKLDISLEDIELIKSDYEISDDEQIEKLIQKKVRYISTPQNFDDKQKIKNRILRLLLSKGYKYDQFKGIVDKYI